MLARIAKLLFRAKSALATKLVTMVLQRAQPADVHVFAIQDIVATTVKLLCRAELVMATNRVTMVVLQRAPQAAADASAMREMGGQSTAAKIVKLHYRAL